MISSQRIMQILAVIASFIVKSLNADLYIVSPDNKTIDIFEDFEFLFGSIPPEGLTGKIVLSNPEDSCSQVQEPPNKQDSFFLLSNRYHCDLVDKVRNAANSGYNAIILYKVEPNRRSNYFTTQDPNYNLDIPAISIRPSDGKKIKSEYLYDKGFLAVLKPGSVAYLLPFAIVIIVCIFMMVSFLVFQIIKCARERRKLLRHRLTKKQLKQLLTTIYTKGSQYDSTLR